MAQRRTAGRSDPGCRRGHRPRVHRRRRGLRGGQDAGRHAVRADPSPRAARAQRRRSRAARARPRRRTTRGGGGHRATTRSGGCGSPTARGRTRWARAAAAARRRWSSRGAPSTSRPSETTVVTVPWTRNEHGATAGLKTTSYADNVIALAHAVERGGSEAIFANTAGNLCEGTGTNVFYVVDGELRTPTLASGLPGRRHPRAGHRVVRCARGRRAAGRRPARRRARRSWPRRPATSRRSRAGTTATSPRRARSRGSARRRGAPARLRRMEP